MDGQKDSNSADWTNMISVVMEECQTSLFHSFLQNFQLYSNVFFDVSSTSLTSIPRLLKPSRLLLPNQVDVNKSWACWPLNPPTPSLIFSSQALFVVHLLCAAQTLLTFFLSLRAWTPGTMPLTEMCNHTFLQELMTKLIPPSQMRGNDQVICCLFFTGIHCFLEKTPLTRVCKWSKMRRSTKTQTSHSIQSVKICAKNLH